MARKGKGSRSTVPMKSVPTNPKAQPTRGGGRKGAK